MPFKPDIRKTDLFRNVMAAMQEAEEITGHMPREDYCNLMDTIAAEASARSKRARNRDPDDFAGEEADAARDFYGYDPIEEHDDTPSLANCDDAGTGEGRYHGRM